MLDQAERAICAGSCRHRRGRRPKDARRRAAPIARRHRERPRGRRRSCRRRRPRPWSESRGETPNLAARLQGAAEPGQILIANNTRRLAGHAFEFEALGARELKGFPHRMPVFRVASEREVESRFHATRGKSLSQFVGRNSEIGILLDRW